MATGIILELLDIYRNYPSDCFIRVSWYDCSIRIILVLIFILFKIVDGQVLAMPNISQYRGSHGTIQLKAYMWLPLSCW